MKKFMTKGILISSVALFSIILIIIPSNVYAENIDIKSFSLEETAILQVTNNSNENIDTFIIWLGDDSNFKSFKTENGWIGEKTPQGVVVFKSSKSLIPGETVKFGIKTDKISSGINWKALNNKNEQLDIGKVLLQEIPKVITNPTINQSVGDGIKTESVFKIIPENLNVGSSIRVVGENFGAHHEFDFYINTEKVDEFTTDSKGHFIITTSIPDEVKSGRSDFKIKDNSGVERKISLRVGELKDRIPIDKDVKLTVNGISNYMFRGEAIDVFGTAQPNKTITLKIINPDNKINNIRNIKVDNSGNWKIEEPIIITSKAILGKYSITISDGEKNILKNWIVKSEKVINVVGIKEKFELGEKLKVQGTGIPDKEIVIIIEDPIGKEILEKSLHIDSSGKIEFEHQIELSYLKGTYKITITQEKEVEKIFVGIGQLPNIPIDIEFDKINYDSGEIAIIKLSGNSFEIINLLIIDPSDLTKGEPITITLQGNGKAEYQLNLQNYKSGIYTAQVSKGNTQNSKQFAVGLQTGSGEITLNTTKSDYYPGESILILGNTGKNSIITISLLDPNEKIIKEEKIFSDKNGIISNDSFRIPNEGIQGTWKLNGKSGSNFDTIEIQVLNKIDEGMNIVIENEGKITGIGEIITIKITGAEQTTLIEINDKNGNSIEEISVLASDEGIINLPWIIPKNIEDGTYTIVAKDGYSSAQLDFEIQ